MDSVVRDSKVNPIGDLVVAITEKIRKKCDEQESLSVAADRVCKEEVKPKKKRKVQWSDYNGNKLVEILEFLPSDVSDSDEDDSNICFCIIM